jgi:hypothetical protein
LWESLLLEVVEAKAREILVEKILQLIDLDWEVVVKHSYREVN